jgi:intracellular sulfur oxidation DsrE/DsrF family protein
MANDAAAPAQAAEPHRLVLQISDDEPAKMRAVLDVAANVARHYSGQGENVEIVVVASNGGLDMLVEDRSPVKERLTNFLKSMPNVSFVACGNTLETLAVKKGKRATADAGRRPGPGRSCRIDRAC